MIHSLFGTAFTRGIDFIVVSTESGLRYRVYIPHSLLENDIKRGSPVDLLVYVHHDRNGNEKMFGFIDSEQYELFRSLISVPKVGPKTALVIIGFPVDVVKGHIIKENYRFFETCKGVGNKTAKSIVLELRKRYVARGNNK